MNILYVFEKEPNEYQQYLWLPFNKLKTELNLKILAYKAGSKVNYAIKSYGLKDYIQRILYKASLSKYRSLDIKLMQKFDIIHIQHSFLFNKIIPLLNIVNRPKIIITLRGGDTYIKPWIDKKWKEFYRQYGNMIDAFVVMSMHHKIYLQKWGIDPLRIHVIPVSFGEQSIASPKFPNSGKLKLVSAFRMTWEKNIMDCIRLAKSLKEKGIDFQYDFYGDGNDFGQLFYLIDRYELSDFVFAKGKIDNDRLKEIYSEYDFIVQLSISEALPATIMEAQAKGIPAIVSDSGGLPEAIIPGISGICHSSSNIEKIVDDLTRIWKDRNLYYQFSKASIDFANETFSSQKEIERLKALYQTLSGV